MYGTFAYGRYRSAALVEVNAHSLFSKYFSESGKLVGVECFCLGVVVSKASSS